MKILNLYAGIGGNRKLWGDEHDITAVENVEPIAYTYSVLYPKDNVVLADAHKYLLEHFSEYDFIWSSPPCPTHSRSRLALTTKSPYCYPDMSLYQEIIFLQQFFKGRWVVENVIPYYDPLIQPMVEIDRHYFWSNYWIPPYNNPRQYNVTRATKEELALYHDIELPPETKEQRKLLRNAVNPKVGQWVFSSQPEVAGQLAMDLIKGDDLLGIAP